MIPFTNIINNHVSSLTESDLVICDYFNTNLESIPTMTLQQVAEATFSSKSNILRLLKKLNFSGFTDFKYYLMAQSDSLNQNQQFDGLMAKLEGIDFDSVATHLKQLIAGSTTIYLFGTGQDQQIQAKNLANYLLKTGTIATFVPLNANADLTANIIKSIQPTDLMIIFSSQGNNAILKTFFANFPKEAYHIVSFTTFKDGWIQSRAELAISLGIQQFQDPTLIYQSGMMHLLLNILSTRLAP